MLSQSTFAPEETGDGLGKSFSRPSRDEFSSKGGSYIKLGNHKSNAASPTKRAYDTTFVSHTPSALTLTSAYAAGVGAQNAQPSNITINRNTGRVFMDMQENMGFDNSGGVLTTKFHKGFQRKGEASISNPAADEVRERMRESHIRGQAKNEQRVEMLYKTNNRNGFNVITGEAKANLTPVTESVGGRRRIEHKISDEVAANSRIALKESPGGRFFMPHATGVKHEYRQKILQTEGRTTPSMSSILAPGNSDLKSSGIEDNFSRSAYPGSQPAPGYARLDLPDCREPGRYTPRKQSGNPSGNPDLVKSWGSGMDISNKAMRGLV